jgi:hypothetical protein
MAEAGPLLLSRTSPSLAADLSAVGEERRRRQGRVAADVTVRRLIFTALKATGSARVSPF